jgi:PAS domain S-box-containing protein
MGSLTFSLSDYHLFGLARLFFWLLGVRVVLVVVCLAGLVVLRKADTPRTIDLTLFTWSVVLALSTTYISFTRPPSYTAHVVINVLVVFGLYCVLPLPLAGQAVPALLLSLGISVLFINADGPNAAMTRIVILTSFSLANALGITVSRGLNGWKRRQWLALSRETRVRAALEASNDRIELLDLEGKVLYSNPGGCRRLGIDEPSLLVGTEWPAMHAEADRPSAREAIANASAGGTGTMVAQCPSWSGAITWWDSVITPIINAGGEVEHLLVISRDITTAKRAEEDLRVALEEVRKLKDQLHQENVYLQEEIKLEHNSDEILGQGEAIKRVLHSIEQVARLDTTVLILGETGTGKELVARAIHNLSDRKARPLVKVNCAALPPSLIESELFGYEKGAFTDARLRKPGRFEVANGGTIFLDEVGELPPESQVKLLRVVQEGEFERLGGSKTVNTDVRIIAATNRDLKAEVESGVFRSDLWYRLNVFPIMVPPLRERSDDISVLVAHFVKRFSKRMGKAIDSVSPAAMKALETYSWPGNVRELANVIERAVVGSRGSTLLLAEPLANSQTNARAAGLRPLEDIERDYIVEALIETRGKIEGPGGAALLLGLNPSTLRGRMAKLRIRRQGGLYARGDGG